MWMPSRPRRRSDWFSSALAALALVVFVGAGAWWYGMWQQQKVQDEVRSSRLLSCLQDAQLSVDPNGAINVCRQKYADRVPALLRDNPYAFVVHDTTASAAPARDAKDAVGSPALPTTLAPSPGMEAASLPDPTPAEGASEEPSEGGNKAAAQAAHPPASNVKPDKPHGTTASSKTAPPKGAHTSATPGASNRPPSDAEACNRHEHDQRRCDPPRSG